MGDRKIKPEITVFIFLSPIFLSKKGLLDQLDAQTILRTGKCGTGKWDQKSLSSYSSYSCPPSSCPRKGLLNQLDAQTILRTGKCGTGK